MTRNEKLIRKFEWAFEFRNMIDNIIMEAQTRPKYNEFLKQWSKDNGITSFFGSDKADFLKDWSNVKTGGVKAKPIVEPVVVKAPEPVVEEAPKPKKKLTKKQLKQLIEDRANNTIETCTYCGAKFDTKKDYYIVSDKGQYCSYECADKANDLKKYRIENEYSSTRRMGEPARITNVLAGL
jgi:hypothetical protein